MGRALLPCNKDDNEIGTGKPGSITAGEKEGGG